MSNENAVLARNVEGAPVSKIYSQTVAFSHYNNLSGQLPINPATGKIVEGGAAAQATQCLKNIKTIVEGINQDLNDVVRLSIFTKDIMDLEAIENAIAPFFPTHQPTKTVAAVAELPAGALVEIEALITNGVGTIPGAPQAGDLLKYTNNTHAAPYSATSTQSVAFSHYNNITAQLPINPETNQLVPGCLKFQTIQVLNNIKAVLSAMDVPMDDIVKTTIFMKDISKIGDVDVIYSTFFPDSGIARAVGYMPARTVVQVKDLPMHADIQIEATVSHGDGTPPQAVEDRHNIIIEANNTSAAPVSKMSTQSVAFSHYNHISAQLPIDAATGQLVAGGISEQALQCFTNIKTIIESVGHSMDDMVKVNVYLKDIKDIDAMNEVFAKCFPGAPARKTIGVGTLPMGALIQVDAVAGNAEGTPPVV